MDSPTRKEIVAGLDQAIRAETDGYHFYMMASQSTQDTQGKEVFEQLAQEEKLHHAFLAHQRESILKEGLVDANFKLKEQMDLSGPSPIFSADLKKRAGEAHYEMSALSIGIQLELNAQKFYTAQAQSVKNEDVVLFYKRLADWESRHYQALLRQQDSLKEDYWEAGGFSPF